MKYILLLIILLTTSSFSFQNKESLEEKNLKKQLEREKKYAQEQRFYSGKEYDLKSFEVNMESVKNLPDVEDTNADFDMDHVYD